MTSLLPSSLSRPHTTTTTDSRLLTNLIKTERSYINHLSSAVGSAHTAASALTAWGTAEAPDIAEASAQLADFFNNVADVQETHVSAIEGYRTALKDVADREASIRNVVRDRDILVGRLIKASKASTSSKRSPEERAEKVAHAQRELSACEEVLHFEEAALVGVKRRTFKEALTLRCKTMGDAGAAMVDAAKSAILLLNDFDSSDAYQPTNSGLGYGHGQHARNDSINSWNQYGDGAEESRHNHPAFENNSVTPSQSASQTHRPGNTGVGSYANRFNDIGEDQDGERGPVDTNPASDDSDDEEGWQEAYGNARSHEGGGQHLSTLPPPHRLDANVGAAAQPFMPPAQASKVDAMNGSNASLNGSAAKGGAAPSLPKKDRPTQRSNAAPLPAPERSFNVVPMPPVPTAPRLNLDGTNLGTVPTAPRLYSRTDAPGQDDSSDEGGPMLQHRGGAWQSRPESRAARQNASSDDEATAKGSSRPGVKRGSSFFGRVGKLFKTDVKGDPMPSHPSSQPQHQTQRNERSGAGWETRTDAALRTSQGPSRRQSLLRPLPGAPRGGAENDSSEEEENSKNLVRHVNRDRPLWRNDEKASSDLGGVSGKVAKRMSLRRQHSVNAGPLSSKQLEEEARVREAARLSVIGAGVAGNASNATLTPGEKTKKKKKKSKASSVTETGSEIGTAPTRTAQSAASGAASRPTSVVIPGAVGSGLGRSGSVTPSVRRDVAALARGDSIRSTASGTVRESKTKKRGSILPAHREGGGTATASGALGAFSPQDPQGKYTTSSWVAKHPDEKSGQSINKSPSVAGKTAAEVAAQAGVVHRGASESAPQQAPLSAPTPRRAPKESSSTVSNGAEPPLHVPQPSRTMSPPLKPALKVTSGMSRSGSLTSSTSAALRPQMPPVPSAPPLASSLLQSATLNAAVQRSSSPAPPRLPEVSQSSPIRADASANELSLRQDDRFDGSGSLGELPGVGAPAAASSDKLLSPSSRRGVDLPQIDMPRSEPFSVDIAGNGPTLADRRGSTPGFSDNQVFFTPGEAAALENFFNTPAPETTEDLVQSRHPPGVHEGQPEGVTRQTVERKRLTPSRTYSAGGPEPQPDTTSSASGTEHGTGNGSRSALPTSTAAVSSSIANAIAVPFTAPSSLAAPPVNAATSDTSTVEGSGVSRRKSVRMAPDVKLPPETPTPRTEAPDYLSRAQARAPGSSIVGVLPRIAPPPTAPPRISDSARNAADYHPVHLEDSTPARQRASWSSRLDARQSQGDSSSDEGEGLDSYASARKAFGSASRHLGKATGVISGASAKSKSKASETESPKKKKKSPTKKAENHGYNAAVPLPAGLQVVGRSNSVRSKK